PVESGCRGFASGCQSRLQKMQRPSAASLERDAGLLDFRPMRSSIEVTLGSSSLGGCPASCPDTYRMTPDHRHVRNWARLEIRLLILLRNIFFRLGTNFLCACLQIGFQRAPGAGKHEQTLTISGAIVSALTPVPQRFLESLSQLRFQNGSMRWAARMNATMISTPIANSTAWSTWAEVSSSPNRIASAPPPANAAPNTSAPIRIAAEMTVTTLGQMISLLPREAGCMLMERVLLRVAISPKRPSLSSVKGPKMPYRVI